MTVEQKRARIRKALDAEFVDLNTTQAQRDRLLHQVMSTDGANAKHAPRVLSTTGGGENVKIRTKMSFSLVLALVLFCVSVTAFAVGVLINEYYERVAQMDASGDMIRWELEDKINFVNVMRDFELTVDEEDYVLMMDSAKTGEEREAAADRMIDARYGALIREEVATWYQQPEDISDVAPDETIIFKERYMAEHPEGITTREDYIQFTDALGYYLRDVYYPAYEEQSASLPQTTAVPEGTEAYAVQSLRSAMTEILGWDAEAVANLTPEVAWDEEYQLWIVSGEVSEESMERTVEPVLNGPTIEKTETGYRLTILVDTQGNASHFSLDKDVFRASYQDEVEAVTNVMPREAAALVKTAVMEKYGLTEEAVNLLFYEASYAGTGDDNALLTRYVFHTHYLYDQENMYGAVINRATGVVTDVYSYQRKDLSPEWKLLFFAAETEQAENWYIRWSMENKQQLLACLKSCQVLPEHPIWSLNAPAESDIDAFVAEVCDAPGYASAVNTKMLAVALLGDEASWNGTDKALYAELQKLYRLSDSNGLAPLQTEAAEIDDADAIRLVWTAFCEAWQLDSSAMDEWSITTQQVHDDYLGRGMVYYRVYMTVPAEKIESFYGRSNFSYRVLIDGTLMDATMMPGWYSPAQDKALLDEQQLYDHELYRQFDRYAQKNGLLMEYEDFFHWPLEHQKAFSYELRTMIADKQQADPTFSDPRLLAFANHVYGVPQDGMLTQDEAVTVAGKALQNAFGLTNAERVYLKPEIVLLDVTDAEHPFYQISYSSEEEWTSSIREGLQPSLYYAVEVNAETGEVLNTYSYGREDGLTGLAAWERWY